MTHTVSAVVKKYGTPIMVSFTMREPNEYAYDAHKGPVVRATDRIAELVDVGIDEIIELHIAEAK